MFSPPCISEGRRDVDAMAVLLNVFYGEEGSGRSKKFRCVMKPQIPLPNRLSVGDAISIIGKFQKCMDLTIVLTAIAAPFCNDRKPL